MDKECDFGDDCGGAEFVRFYPDLNKDFFACGPCMNTNQDADPTAEWTPLFELEATP